MKKTTQTIFPAIFLILAFVMVEGLLLRLGVWQMHRMEQKEAEKSAFMDSLDARTTTLKGHFDHSREVALESQQRRNDYGYRILTPFLTATREVIVDRGWVHRSFAPNYLERFRVSDGKNPDTITVTGVMRTPPELQQTFLKGPTESAGGEGVRVLKYIKLDELPPHPTLPRAENYLQATSSPHPNVDAFYVPPEGGAQHKEYMLTWFGLAVVLPFLLLIILRRRRRQA